MPLGCVAFVLVDGMVEIRTAGGLVVGIIILKF